MILHRAFAAVPKRTMPLATVAAVLLAAGCGADLEMQPLEECPWLHDLVREAESRLGRPASDSYLCRSGRLSGYVVFDPVDRYPAEDLLSSFVGTIDSRGWKRLEAHPSPIFKSIVLWEWDDGWPARLEGREPIAHTWEGVWVNAWGTTLTVHYMEFDLAQERPRAQVSISRTSLPARKIFDWTIGRADRKERTQSGGGGCRG